MVVLLGNIKIPKGETVFTHLDALGATLGSDKPELGEMFYSNGENHGHPIMSAVVNGHHVCATLGTIELDGKQVDTFNVS